MKGKYLLSLLLSFVFISFVYAQTPTIPQTPPWPSSLDTVWLQGGQSNAGVLENAISGDTVNGGRVNPNRVYALYAGQIYVQNSAFTFDDANATLNIVGQPGVAGTVGNPKPIIMMVEVNGVEEGSNLITGSIHLDNLYWIAEDASGNFPNDPFQMSTATGVPQTVVANNCLFEFAPTLDWFNTDAWHDGAKIKFTNCYWRDQFYGAQWWGGRVLYMKHRVDSLWVENCCVTEGGLVFLTQNSLVTFNYYNHNTIVNTNKYWQLGQNFLEGYWVNNLFLNENWVGEDSINIASGQDQDGEFFSTINLDTLYLSGGSLTNHIIVAPKYQNADSTINQSLLGLGNMIEFVADNMHYTDTTMLDAYYLNQGGFFDTSYVGQPYPASYVNWSGKAPIAPIQNVPGEWMNWRTKGLFDGHLKNFVAIDNIATPFNTVTPAIVSKAVGVLMGEWDEAQYGAPQWSGTTLAATLVAWSPGATTNYLFGDFSASTLPGYDASGNKTETDGSGIALFSDLLENLNQAGTVQLSKIDNLPIGCLLFDATKNAAYVAADPVARLALVKAAYQSAVLTGVKLANNTQPNVYKLSQNYPNPFNPTTNISYAIPVSGNVSLKVYNILGQEVATVFQGFQKSGSYIANFDASRLASGVYFYRLQAGQFSQTKKMMYLK
jgi:hypothetical protein